MSLSCHGSRAVRGVSLQSGCNVDLGSINQDSAEQNNTALLRMGIGRTMDTEYVRLKGWLPRAVWRRLYITWPLLSALAKLELAHLVPNSESLKGLIDIKSIDMESFDLNLTARDKG